MRQIETIQHGLDEVIVEAAAGKHTSDSPLRNCLGQVAHRAQPPACHVQGGVFRRVRTDRFTGDFRGKFRLDAPGMQSLTVPTAGNAPLSRVIIWHDECLAQSCGIKADEWLSEFLGGPHHLVYMPDSTRRPVDPEYRIADARVSFADAFPFLLATTASLEDLNTRLDQPVPMNRFRPNLVIDGSAAFAEDGWREMRIGTMTFSVVKPCARCAVTTVNQATAETAREPLRTLSRFRLIDGKAMFGQNLIHGAPGRVAVGDPVEIVATA